MKWSGNLHSLLALSGFCIILWFSSLICANTAWTHLSQLSKHGVGNPGATTEIFLPPHKAVGPYLIILWIFWNILACATIDG